MFIPSNGLYAALAVLIVIVGTTLSAADSGAPTCEEIMKTTNELEPKFLTCKVYHDSMASAVEAIRVTKELEHLLILNGIAIDSNDIESLNGSEDMEESREKRKHEYLRFGKRKHEYLRFGKRKHEYLRFGRK
uniref:FMRFamide-related neuropeptides-like n=1 Tax=Parastrongyloides trichosuri TaxID=131310 RepID=A0A0N4ZD07_PARTI